MTNKTILLIRTIKDLNNSDLIIGPRRLEQLGLEYLAAALEKEGYTSHILSGNVTEDDIKEAIQRYKPLVCGFSTYTYTLNDSIRLAHIAKEEAKKMDKTLTIVFGGYHSSSLPEEVLSFNVVDFVIIGEGDVTLCELLKEMEKDSKAFESIKGIAFMKNTIFIKTHPRERIKNLDSLPIPKRELSTIDIPKRAELAYPRPSQQKCVSQIMYSRGCPFNCLFCDSKNTWGNGVFFRSPQSVVDEAQQLINNYQTNYLGFLDLTFNANKKKVLELCEEFIHRDLPAYWYCLCRYDLFDEETLEAMAKAKCTKVSVGIESLDKETASHIKDHIDISDTNLHKGLKIANDLGIIIRAFLIIGFPNETKEMISTYLHEIQKHPIDELRITIATPFPCTQLWHKCKEQNLLPQEINWDDFTTEKLLFKHPYLTGEELYYFQNSIVQNYYFSETYTQHVLSKIQKHPHLKDSWLEFFTFLQEKNIFKNYNEKINQLQETIKNCPKKNEG